MLDQTQFILFISILVLLVFVTNSRTETEELLKTGLNNVASENKSDLKGMIYIRGGCFEMGSFSENQSMNSPNHTVCVNNFFIGETEVTQGLWESVMKKNPSYFKGANNPVDSVSFSEINKFIQKLNLKTGKSFRLPTEAEWEYAARSGGKINRWAGTNNKKELSNYAWFRENSEKKTHPVKQLKSNDLGLYDMTGNVWEWVSDWYDENYYKNSPKDNPQGPLKGENRIVRGGSWTNGSDVSDSSFRGFTNPDVRFNSYGFRLACSVSSS